MILSEIFDSEYKNCWEKAASQYDSLYDESPSSEVAAHFAFFCWYLLWQWDEISFPGETLSPYEKFRVDTRNGISKEKLFSNLDSTTKYLLNMKDETATKYLIVLCHMKKIYPYFFDDTIFSDTEMQQLINFVKGKKLGDLGTTVLYDYLQTQNAGHITSEEKVAVNNLFPRHSLMQSYFNWLFN